MLSRVFVAGIDRSGSPTLSEIAPLVCPTNDIIAPFTHLTRQTAPFPTSVHRTAPLEYERSACQPSGGRYCPQSMISGTTDEVGKVHNQGHRAAETQSRNVCSQTQPPPQHLLGTIHERE